MKESFVDCPYLKDATALAHKKGLLPKNQFLKCGLEDVCTRVECLKINNPNYRTIPLKQSWVVNCVSPIDKFYGRLDKWKAIVSGNQD